MTRRMLASAGVWVLMGAASLFGVDKQLSCGDGGGRNHRVCAMQENTMPASARLDVDAAPNGGISVQGWEKNEILVRAKVEAWGDTEAEAQQRLKEVKVIASGGKVKADGPKSMFGGNQKWSVTFEIFTPTKINLGLETVNGGITVRDVSGDLSFETVNGGITLARIGGNAKGETVNGGINVELSGKTWAGDRLEVETVNGGVNVEVPEGYSAQFKAETTNGGLSADFPGAQVKGTWGHKSLDMTLGSGGPVVKVETVNGGLKIRKRTV
jgi:hypothetical protein